MRPTEEKLFILDLLKLNKSETVYSEETVVNIIKQVLKMNKPVEQEKPSESAEEIPCNKCEFNGRSSPCEQCNPTNDYEHFFYHDPYSKESMDFFRVFIKARKELCAISPTNTYSFEEAIRKTFDEYASQKHLPTDEEIEIEISNFYTDVEDIKSSDKYTWKELILQEKQSFRRGAKWMRDKLNNKEK